MNRTLLLIASLAVSSLLAWLALTGPPPAAWDAPAQVFSAERAMADVRVVATEPHTVGTRANEKVRDYLVGRMGRLGLEPRLQAAVAISDKTKAPVRLFNIIAILPGRDRTAPAVALMSHYDSTPRGPGAGDAASGVASVLEIARILKAEGPPARDVVFILTDGEEDGMLGAKAFFNGDAEAQRLGFVVNLEARGSRGRAMMFETGRGNGETVRLFAGAAERPLSNSLMVMVYDLMPNFTDFTVAKDAGLQGVNFAFLGGAADYHAPTDTPENLDRRSLQDIGAQALAVVRRAAHGELPAAAPDAAYSDVLGLGVIAYPPRAGWAVLVASLALWGAAVVRAGRPNLKDAAIGAIAALGVAMATAALLAAFGLGLGAARFPTAMRPVPVEAAGFAIGLAVLAAAAWLVRGRRSAWIWAGALLSGLAVTAAVQAVAPAAAPIVAWPLAVGCLAAALSGLGSKGVVVAAALAIPALAFAAVLSHLSFLALLSPLGLAAWAWIAAVLLAPLVGRVKPV